MELKAVCKINIGLDILRRRSDGFHDVETLMFPVEGLYDTIGIERSASTEFRQSGLVVDCPPEKNLCLKALRALERYVGIGPVTITLDKRVPFGAGLGGGSSDAAAVIRGLNELFGLGLSTGRMVEIAAELGSDTAFFIESRPQICSGRGEIMSPFDPPIAGLWLAVIKPPFGISTAQAYAGVTPHIPDRPLAQRLAAPISEWQTTIVNDFERHLFALYPQLGELKRALLDAGAIYAAMSGSGSALFGLFEQKPELTFDPSIFVHTEQIAACSNE